MYLNAQDNSLSMADVTRAVFWALLIIAVFLCIANVPLLQEQKKYFYWLGALMFLYYPIVILHSSSN